MENDPWKANADKLIDAHEQAFWDYGHQYLLAVEKDLTNTLGLGELSFSKASQGERHEAYSSALRHFAHLSTLKQLLPKNINALADMITKYWYSTMRIESWAKARKVRTFLAGYLKNNLKSKRPKDPPKTIKVAGRVYSLDDATQNALIWAEAHTAEHITGLRENTRRKINQVILAGLEANQSKHDIARQLFTGFAGLNKDWRRIAITEANSAFANGLLAGSVGHKAKFTVAGGACKFCLAWDGHMFDIVSPDKANKNPLKEVWLGKNNVGRSFYTTTREGRKRSSSEIAIPTIPAHPHCRCQWLIIRNMPKGVNKEFERYLRERLTAVG